MPHRAHIHVTLVATCLPLPAPPSRHIPAVTVVPTPRVDPDTSLPLSTPIHRIAGEVCLSPCRGAAPSDRCCDPETMADGRWPNFPEAVRHATAAHSWGDLDGLTSLLS